VWRKWQAAYGVLMRRRLNKYKAASLLGFYKEFNWKVLKECENGVLKTQI
jgi:hypothetical protein